MDEIVTVTTLGMHHLLDMRPLLRSTITVPGIQSSTRSKPLSPGRKDWTEHLLSVQ